MNYLINPGWFYLINMIDNLSNFNLALLGICAVGTIASFMHLVTEDYDLDEIKEFYRRKIPKCMLILLVISSLLTIFIPNKQTCQEMLIASYITEENIDYGKEQVKDIVDYIIEKTKEVNENDIK